MTDNTTLVLIHGAGLNGAIWSRMAAYLTTAHSIAELPHRREPQATAALGLADYSGHVAAAVRQSVAGKVILVGHSIGGTVAQEVAGKLGAQVRAIVGIGAVFPRKGKSFLAEMPLPQRMLLPLLLRLIGTRPPASSIRHGLCSGLGPEQAQSVAENFTPEGRCLFTGKANYEAFHIPALCVLLCNDREIPRSMQQALAERFISPKIVELQTGHLPMLEQPKALARILDEFAATI